MRWITIRGFHLKEKVMHVPNFLENKFLDTVTVKFGGMIEQEVTVKIITAQHAEDPNVLLMSDTLIESLRIQEDLPYQIKFKETHIIIGPVIGLLLGKQCLYYSPKNIVEHTHALNQYAKTGGIFYTFTPDGVDYDKKLIYGLYYNPQKGWQYGHFPFPDVIFRRGFSGNESQVNKIRNHVCDKIFNSSRRNKWQIHRLLEKDEMVHPFLPQTSEVSESTIVSAYLKKYKTVILKPTNLSRGRGIFILQKNKNNIEVINCLEKDTKKTIIAESQLETFLLNGGFFNQHYIVQNRIDLACVNGSPFDIRVVMHKNTQDKWACSGIECRIAGMDNMISNIARGGRALSINRTLLLAFGPHTDTKTLKKQVIELSTHICECMDATGELFAEFGLDIAIDKNKHLWFIEANVRPSFKGFKSMDYRGYLHICSRPIIYATHLAGFESDGEIK